MNSDINFTVGFSHGVEWGWPIAVYLLLAGISGGAMIVSLMIRTYKGQKDNTPLMKASSLVAFVTIAFGMVFLVGDLEKPLYFWKILINYNFKSVMSIGVIAISFYIPLTMLMCVYAFEDVIKKYFSFLSFFIKLLKYIRPQMEFLTLVFAVIICAYTGFLISVLVRFPILNTAILPALFVVSGLSAGNSASGFIALMFFKEDLHSEDMRTIHKIEWPIMATEIMFLFMLYISLLVGSEFQKSALEAFSSGVWANLFWFGVVGIGFILPFTLNFLLGKKVANTRVAFYISCLAGVLGVFCLRMFILYAGQTFGV